MTAEQFARDLEALIAIVRHARLSDQELVALMREAIGALVPAPSPVSRIVQSRSKKAPRPTPAIAVPVVVWREMKEGPSEPPCRRRLQTAMSCFDRKVTVVNVMVKRRG